jgi:hypothetical protein
MRLTRLLTILELKGHIILKYSLKICMKESYKGLSYPYHAMGHEWKVSGIFKPAVS